MSSASLSCCACSAVGAGGRWSRQEASRRTHRMSFFTSGRIPPRPKIKKGPPRRTAHFLCVKSESLLVLGRVRRRVGVGRVGVRRVERGVSVRGDVVAGGGVHVGRRGVLNRGLVRRIVGSVILVARGDAEREDRN